MRLNRMRRREIKTKESKTNHLLFFIVLPISAIIIGYVLAEFFIIPRYFPKEFYATSEEREGQENPSPFQVEYRFPEIKGVYLQLGSFSTKENGEAFCQEIQSLNIPCSLWEEEKFIVLTGGIMEDSTLEYIKEQLNKNEIDFFRRDISLSSWKETLTSEEEKERLETQIFSMIQWLKEAIHYIWTVENNPSLEKDFVKSIETLEEAINREILFTEKNHLWNQYIQGFQQELQGIKKQPGDIHEIYQVIDKNIQNLKKIYH